MTAGGGLLLLVVLLPVLAPVAAISPVIRQWLPYALPLLPLPALAVAFLAPEVNVEYPSILLGLRLQLDEIGRVFLLVTSAIWSAVGLHLLHAGLDLRKYAHGRFLFCYLLTMTGNLGVVLATDPVGFYLFFSLLSLAAYGLIVTDDGAETREAGRLYLLLAVFGEMLMLGGFILLLAGLSGWILAVLFYFGMGIKHGVLPLHVWLPRAHGMAPPPASALLSGALLKAGIIGWLRFLPEHGPVVHDMAPIVVVTGIAAGFYAAVVGSLQKRPKMLLAYSSISQLGLITATFGVAMREPGLWAAGVPVLLLFTVHHASVKASLFLAMGVSRAGYVGRGVFPVMLLLCLSLAGAPAMGGALVKISVDHLARELTEGMGTVLILILPLSSVATTLLMARFLWLAREEPAGDEGPGRRLSSPWAFYLLAALGLIGPWILFPEPVRTVLAMGVLWKTGWPVLLGIAVALMCLLLIRKGLRLSMTVPPGDIVVPLERFLRGRNWLWPTVAPKPRHMPDWRRWVLGLEAHLRPMSVVGIAYLLGLLVLAALGIF